MPNIYSSHKNGNLSRLKCFGMLNFKCLCIVAIEKVFLPYKGLYTLRYEAGQFLLTIIYTICTWIKINILYGHKDFFYVASYGWKNQAIVLIMREVHTTQKHNCVKCTQPLWCIIYESRTYTTVKIYLPPPHYFFWNFFSQF